MMFKEAFGVVWQSLKDAWEDLFGLSLINITWLFTSLTVLLLPVSTAGVYYATNRIAHGKTVHYSDFIDGAKKFWWRSWLWFLGNLVFLFLTYYSLAFYTSITQGFFAILIGGFWLAVILVWLGMQVYFWPMLVEQSDPNVLQAWRNSFILVMQQPFFTVVLFVVELALFLISIVLPIGFILVYMIVTGIMANNATVTLLVKAGFADKARPPIL